MPVAWLVSDHELNGERRRSGDLRPRRSRSEDGRHRCGSGHLVVGHRGYVM